MVKSLNLLGDFSGFSVDFLRVILVGPAFFSDSYRMKTFMGFGLYALYILGERFLQENKRILNGFALLFLKIFLVICNTF